MVKCLGGSAFLPLSCVAARETVMTQDFLFVQQEGERSREESAGKVFINPDPATCTGGRLHSGRTHVL